MTQNSCCVPGCLVTSKDGVGLHCFPNPDTDTERFQTWISNVGLDMLQLDNDTIRKKKRVCHKHFKSIYHYTKNRLCRLATPELHMPAMQTLVPVEEVIADEQIPSTSTDLQSKKLPIAKKDKLLKKRVPASSIPSIPLKHQNQLNKQIKQLRKCKNEKLSFKSMYIAAKKISKLNAFDVLSKNMSNATKMFCKMQITQSGKEKKGRRFTLDEKILALSLYKPSPKAYRLLSTICTLPSRRTLQNLLHKIKVKPGINELIFENLKKRVESMPNNHKYCTLVFDEMAIGPSVSYDKKNDCIIGLVDNGIDKGKEFCDHVLVFMVRGIIKKYKQPVVYSYCRGSTKTPELKRQIKRTIEKIQQTGLKIIATVCDQGASNVAAINQLLAETKECYIKSGLEYTGGFFNVSKEKIFPLYDPPHLIKGVRNNLISKNLTYIMNDKKCIAKWSHIEALYNRSPGYKGMKLVPKLTAHHVVPALIPRMRVKHCTQVLSKSVGVALGFMAECGTLPKESTDTADLLILFDELFDSVNGSFSKIQKGKIYRAALTPTSPHHRFWNKILPILKTMKFMGSINQGVVPSLASWVKTIEGFRLIFKYLNSKGISSLLLRNFNQDALENFFGAIRAHGYSNIMPISSAFEGAYKTLLINNISSSHSIGANCEKDDSVCLQSLKYFFNIEEQHIKVDHVIEENHIMIDLIDTQELLEGQSRMQIERSAAIGYCSGWIAQLAKKNVFKNCSTCKKDLESDVEQSFHQFINKKEYSNKKLLCYPSRPLFDFFAHVEQLTIEILKTNCNKNNISEYIKLIISTNLNLNFVSCLEHKEILIIYLLKKSTHFFIYNWCKDINNVLTGKTTFWDINDAMKNAAYKYYEKNKGRKRKTKQYFDQFIC